MIKYTRYVIVFDNGEDPEPADRLFCSREAAQLEGETRCEFIGVKEVTLVFDNPPKLKLVPVA